MLNPSDIMAWAMTQRAACYVAQTQLEDDPARDLIYSHLQSRANTYLDVAKYIASDLGVPIPDIIDPPID